MLEELYSQLKEFGVRVGHSPFAEEFVIHGVKAVVTFGTKCGTIESIRYFTF